MRNYLSRRNNDLGFGFFDDVFEDFLRPVFYSPSKENMKTDIKESEKDYSISIDMPGFDKKDIALTLSDGYLTVEATREEKEEDANNYIKRERSFSCKRSYHVGDAVTEEDIKAKYNNGTLFLTVPKKNKQITENKNIQIED